MLSEALIGNGNEVDRRISASMPDLSMKRPNGEPWPTGAMAIRQCTIGSPETYRMPDLVKKLNEYKLNDINQRVEIFHLYQRLCEAGLSPHNPYLDNSLLEPIQSKHQLSNKDLEIAELKHKLNNQAQECQVKMDQMASKVKALEDRGKGYESVALQLKNLQRENKSYSSAMLKMRKENEMLQAALAIANESANESDSSASAGMLNRRERELYEVKSQLVRAKMQLEREQQLRDQLAVDKQVQRCTEVIEVGTMTTPEGNNADDLMSKYEQALGRIGELEYLIDQAKYHAGVPILPEAKIECNRSSSCKNCDLLKSVIAKMRRKWLDRERQEKNEPPVKEVAHNGHAFVDDESVAMWLRNTACSSETLEAFKEKLTALHNTNQKLHERMQASTRIIKNVCEKLTSSGVDVSSLSQLLSLHTDMLENISVTQSLYNAIETTINAELTTSQLEASKQHPKLVDAATSPVAKLAFAGHKWTDEALTIIPWLQNFSDDFFELINIVCEIEQNQTCTAEQKMELLRNACEHFSEHMMPHFRSCDVSNRSGLKAETDSHSRQASRASLTLDTYNVSLPPEHVLYGEIKGTLEQAQRVKEAQTLKDYDEQFNRLVSMLKICEEVAKYMVKQLENCKESTLATADGRNEDKALELVEAERASLSSSSHLLQDGNASAAMPRFNASEAVEEEQQSLVKARGGDESSRGRLQVLLSGSELMNERMESTLEQIQGNNAALMSQLNRWREDLRQMRDLKRKHTELTLENRELKMKIDSLEEQLRGSKGSFLSTTSSKRSLGVSDRSLEVDENGQENNTIEKGLLGQYNECKAVAKRLLKLVRQSEQDDTSKGQLETVINDLNQALSNVRSRSVLMANHMKRTSGNLSELKLENEKLREMMEVLKGKLKDVKGELDETVKSLNCERQVKQAAADELIRELKLNTNLMKKLKKPKK